MFSSGMFDFSFERDWPAVAMFILWMGAEWLHFRKRRKSAPIPFAKRPGCPSHLECERFRSEVFRLSSCIPEERLADPTKGAKTKQHYANVLTLKTNLHRRLEEAVVAGAILPGELVWLEIAIVHELSAACGCSVPELTGYSNEMLHWRNRLEGWFLKLPQGNQPISVWVLDCLIRQLERFQDLVPDSPRRDDYQNLLEVAERTRETLYKPDSAPPAAAAGTPALVLS